MPIKGITDSVQAAFPRIGKLRKGGEAKRNEQGQVVRMGADLEYFRFTSERPEVQAAFEDAYGDKPALVTVYLPYAGVEANFQCWKERWAAGGLVHRCDGETMALWLGPDGKHRRDPKPCDGGCDEVGRLSVIIPELVKAGFVGFVVLETHGINDLLSIQASLMAAAEARVGNELGLRGIRWTLRRVKEKVSTPVGNGKRARRDKWLVKLEPAADWVALQLQAAHNATMMLPAPRVVDEETGEVHSEEAPHVDDAELGEYVPVTAEELAEEEQEEEQEHAHDPADLGEGDLAEERRNLASAQRTLRAHGAKMGWSLAELDRRITKRYGENVTVETATLDQLNDACVVLSDLVAKAGK